MRTLSLLVVMGCGKPVPASPPPVAPSPVRAPPTVSIADASVDAAPADPLATLPTAEPALADGDATAVDAYYKHAAAIAASSPAQALARLLQLARRPRCVPCSAAL